MSLITGATAWNAAQLQQARYYYERLPYTAMDPALAANTTPLVVIQNVGSAIPHGVAILGGIGVTNTANVSLQMSGATNTDIEPTDGYPPYLASTQTEADDGWRSTGNLSLNWQNLNGVALTVLQQIHWYGAVKTLTTADKILRGLPLSPTDQAFAVQYGLTTATGQLVGLRLQTIRKVCDVWREAIIESKEQTLLMASVVGGAQAQLQLTVQPKVVGQEVLVWNRIGAYVPAASVGNGVIISIRRDSQDNLVSFFADGLNLTTPLQPWMTATETFQVSVGANTTTADVALRVGWLRCRLTRNLAIMLGLVAPADYSATDQKWAHQLQAGVM